MKTMNHDPEVIGVADGYVNSLTDLWARIDGPDDDDSFEELDELPLEIVWEKGEPFAVVLGTGGPHVEITGGGRQGGYALSVYWGSGQPVHRRGEAVTRTGDYFRDQMEELDG